LAGLLRGGQERELPLIPSAPALAIFVR